MLPAGCPKLCSISPSLRVEGTASVWETAALEPMDSTARKSQDARQTFRLGAAHGISSRPALAQASPTPEGLEVDSSSEGKPPGGSRHF